MELIKPIKLSEKDTPYNGVLYNEAISLINEAITIRRWHDNFADIEKYRKEYYAILLPIHNFNSNLWDKVVRSFKDNGWDCLYKHCYDARGPHNCFYINKKHF